MLVLRACSACCSDTLPLARARVRAHGRGRARGAEEAASAESIAAASSAAAMRALPPGVAELTLADLIAELSEHVAAAVPPAWSGEKGRARAARCVTVTLQAGAHDDAGQR